MARIHKMLRPEDLQHSFEVEPLVDEFVLGYGGELVRDLFPPSPTFDNADYFFREHNVVAELKTLEKDAAAPGGVMDKAERLVEGWVRSGEVGALTLADPSLLPRAKRRALQRVYQEPLRRTIKKANRQLRETAERLGLRDPHSLLLLANDGYYTLAAQSAFYFAQDILTREFSHVHGLVYFTVNSYVTVPDDEYARQVWATSYAPSAPAALVDFVDDLGHAWFDFFGQKIGGWDDRIRSPDRSILDDATFIRPPPGRTAT
jgi:hypothetical protein